MKKIVCFILCLVIIICFCGCASQDEHSNKSPAQTAAERLDPEGLMTPETFTLKKRQVINKPGYSIEKQYQEIQNYYGTEAQIHYEIGDDVAEDTVESISYRIKTNEDEFALSTLELMLSDIIEIWGTVQEFTIDGTEMPELTLDEIQTMANSDTSYFIKWTWFDTNYHFTLTAWIGKKIPKYYIYTEYSQPLN